MLTKGLCKLWEFGVCRYKQSEKSSRRAWKGEYMTQGVETASSVDGVLGYLVRLVDVEQNDFGTPTNDSKESEQSIYRFVELFWLRGSGVCLGTGLKL